MQNFTRPGKSNLQKRDLVWMELIVFNNFYDLRKERKFLPRDLLLFCEVTSYYGFGDRNRNTKSFFKENIGCRLAYYSKFMRMASKKSV